MTGSQLDLIRDRHQHKLVELVYRTMLGREPEDEAVTNYCKILADAGSIGSVVRAIQASEEYVDRIAATTRLSEATFAEDIGHIHSIGKSGAKLFLGTQKKKYLFNLSTSNHWRAHPVGIIRLERELAKYLTRYRNVEFVIWDKEKKALKKLAEEKIRNILSPKWCESGGKGFATYNPNDLDPLKGPAADVFISVGLDWDLSPVHDVVAYLRNRGTKAIMACYDIVPILFPDLVVRESLVQEFKSHFVEMAHGASRVMAISDASKRDLTQFWFDAKLEAELPPVKVVPLASYTTPSKLPVLSEKDNDILQYVLGRGEYVLYVSSFEARKNHKLLMNLWRELYAKRGDKCPQLVKVGMKGWGVDDLLNQIPRMSVYLGGKINWMQNVRDDLLQHLYHHCLFTVFPSLYEGWGLAASESLAFGKVCVVANNSSLPQATQGLMPSYHPLDYLGWKGEIEKLLDHPKHRLDLEQRIRKEYKHRSWDDFAADFCGELLTGDDV